MLKSEKGVTLTSVIIYVLMAVIVVGAIARISSVFYNNVQYMQNSNKASQITKFNSLIVEETQTKQNKIEDIEDNYIYLSSNNKYTFADNAIYKNSIKICRGITSCTFTKQEINENKQLLTVEIKAGEITRTIEYVFIQ